MKRILPLIVISQFFCTSPWFAGNAVVADITRQFHLSDSYLANLITAVQLGFISGTLFFAILSIADRFSPSKVFFASSLISAAFNLAITIKGITITEVIACRFFTGFFLAGIYPVGMKIAADHYAEKLGRSLGFLVGALVLGTALPHLLKGVTVYLPWNYVVFTTSILSVLGGLAILLFVPDGPYRKPGTKPAFGTFLTGFRNKDFRAAAFGYFGHMWELYAFWVFVPVMLAAYNARYPMAGINVPVLSFLIIAAGSIACIISGMLSLRFGAKRIATAALSISCACCLISPLFLFISSSQVFIIFLFVWSVAVIADSPLFSTLVAANAPVTSRGSALTIVNSIGFFITIISIQLVSMLLNENNTGHIYMLLAAGPLLGLIALVRNKTTV